MFTKILFYTLISAVLVQSRSVRELSNVADTNQDANIKLDENGQSVNVNVTGIVDDQVTHKSEGGVRGFLTSLRDSVIEAIDDAVRNFRKEVDSIVGIADSSLNAAKTILDAKATILASIPKAGIKALGGLRKD